MDDTIKKGDIVIASWTTPRGTAKRARGSVIEATEKRVRIEYVRTVISGRSVNMEVKQPWFRRDQVCRVERTEDDVPAQKIMRGALGLK